MYLRPNPSKPSCYAIDLRPLEEKEVHIGRVGGGLKESSSFHSGSDQTRSLLLLLQPPRSKRK
jgi:hypothetical protein